MRVRGSKRNDDVYAIVCFKRMKSERTNKGGGRERTRQAQAAGQEEKREGRNWARAVSLLESESSQLHMHACPRREQKMKREHEYN
jgi:diadenosine tetraphosphate (Ap4A) HIT family hydrolase